MNTEGSTNQHIKSLAKFQLAYEHDKTWHEAKVAVRARSASK